MVNFRFHIVSLTAVFLAIALGIAVGVTVVDKNIVGVKEAQIRKLNSQLSEVKNQKKQVDQELGSWNRFENDIDDVLFAGRLSGLDVLVFSPAGTNDDVLTEVSDALRTAGARQVGMLQLNDKWNAADSVPELATVATQTSTDPQVVRQTAMNSLVERLVDASKPAILPELIKRGYLDWKSGDDATVTPESLLVGNNTQVVVIGSRAAGDLPENAMVPLARALASSLAQRFVIATTIDDDNEALKTSKSAMMSLIRKDSLLDGKATTVDNVEGLPGRTALVLSMADLTAGRVGDYGIESSASRAVPGEAK